MIPLLITVHDSATVRDSPNWGYDFNKNGLAILTPSMCRVTEELNGSYHMEMEHPIDEYGKWRHLNEFNIISVPILERGSVTRQLFRIVRREVVDSGASKSVRILAHHVFYDLGAQMVENPYFGGASATLAIRQLYNNVFTSGGTIGKTWYPFTWYSDIELDTSTYYAYSAPKTMVELMLTDDHSIANLFGGEIHRDNYGFSICKQKEGSVAHDVPIRYGVDLIEISEIVDVSQVCNYAHAYIDDGNWNDIAFDSYGKSFGDIVRMQQFHYKQPTMEKLAKDMDKFFYSRADPIVTLKVKYRDIANKPEYADFYATRSYLVGDTVPIMHERLGIDAKYKVSVRVFDVLRQSTESLTFGTIPREITRRGILSDTVFESSEDVQYILSQEGLYIGKKGTGENAVVINTGTAPGRYAFSGNGGKANGDSSTAFNGSTAYNYGCFADTGGNAGKSTLPANTVVSAHADSRGTATAMFGHADSVGESYTGGSHADSGGKVGRDGQVAYNKMWYSHADSNGSALADGAHANSGGVAQESGTFAACGGYALAVRCAAVGLGAKMETPHGVAIGPFNKTYKNTLFVVGGGTSDTDRKDLMYFDENGNCHIMGDLYVNDVKIN